MKKQSKKHTKKPTGLAVLEYLLLAMFLAILALRTTLTEGINPQSLNQPLTLGQSVFSIVMSGLLLLSFALWMLWFFLSGKISYRLTKMEIGLAILTVAAVIACAFAPNKRAAITHALSLLAPFYAAIVLVQLLDSPAKIILTLIFIIALALTTAYQCTEQYYSTNQARIDRYESRPLTILQPLGIEKGTFNHMLFEHRLYSKDVNGFYTTGNSAGCFLLIAAFTCAAIIVWKFSNRHSEDLWPLWIITGLIALAAIIFALALTKSKGTIGSTVLAALMLAVFFAFRNWLKANKKSLLAIAALLMITAASALIACGIRHDSLPGGNSMHVRWQYWVASIKMFCKHPLTGAGPANYGNHYTEFKHPGAIETVGDPHNFPLSLLTQYGPLGLIGFALAIFSPLCKILFPRNLPPPAFDKTNHFTARAGTYLVIASAVMLAVRPALLPITGPALFEETIAAAIVLYIFPVAVFVIGFILVALGTKPALKHSLNHIKPFLFVACIAVLIHNLIDFAIFEPGILMSFLALIACLIAVNYTTRKKFTTILARKWPLKIIIIAAFSALSAAYIFFAIVPDARATSFAKSAHQATARGKNHTALQLLKKAATADPLDPAPLKLSAKLYLQQYNQYKNTGLLHKSLAALKQAVSRNPADYKCFEHLAEVYNHLAEAETGEAGKWLNKASLASKKAINRYPGCARLRIRMAQIAEKLEKPQLAAEQYKQAIEIENAYRTEFKKMFPDEPVFSRLGSDEYELAKKRLKILEN